MSVENLIERTVVRLAGFGVREVEVDRTAAGIGEFEVRAMGARCRVVPAGPGYRLAIANETWTLAVTGDEVPLAVAAAMSGEIRWGLVVS